MSIHRQLAVTVAISLLVVACAGSAAPTPLGAPSSAAPSAAALESAGASAAASASPTIAVTPSPSLVPTADPTPTLLPTAAPTPTPLPTPTPAPTPVALTLDAHVWWGGYAIDISGASYDPVKRKLLITSTFLNTSTASSNVSSLGSELNIIWNGTYFQGFFPNGAVLPGGTVSGEIQFGPPTGFTPDTAILTFGQPTEHQAIVPLNGGTANSEQPASFPVSGKVQMGKYVAYTVQSGSLVPASCAGSPSKLQYGAMQAADMSIVLGGIATNSEAGGAAFIDKAFLTLPDGTTSAAKPDFYVSVISKGNVRDARMCFSVPAPASGTYKLTMHELRSKKNGSITFLVP